MRRMTGRGGNPAVPAHAAGGAARPCSCRSARARPRPCGSPTRATWSRSIPIPSARPSPCRWQAPMRGGAPRRGVRYGAGARRKLGDHHAETLALPPAQGVTFHDGSPLTADDVVFSADRVRADGSAW